MANRSIDRPKGKQGFASMAPDLRRAICSKGGKSIPAALRAFSRRQDLAREAGRKGGLATGRNRLGARLDVQDRLNR
jgi:general stress protein YciG